MSPIVDGLDRRLPELGRIRTGATETYQRDGQTRTRPARLETFRLTSATRELLDVAAEVYGGEVAAWQSATGPEWEIVTATDALEVVVPPVGGLAQWWELWTRSGLARRCDGRTEQLTLHECACPADPASRRELAAKGGACRPMTTLAVMLPALPGLGTWRLVTGSAYAAIELGGTAEILARASAAGEPVPARLRLDVREKRIAGQPTTRYAVPRLEAPTVWAAALPGSGLPPPAITSGTPRDAGPRMLAPGPTPPELRPVPGVDPDAFAAAAAELYPGVVNLDALAPAARARVLAELEHRPRAGASR